MHLLSILMIVAAGIEPSIEGQYPAATKLLECNFDEAADRDYDLWPDGWTRRHGPGFPLYLKIGIVNDQTPTGHRSLQIDMDGGGAVIYSPRVPVAQIYDYMVECQLRCEGLQSSTAFLALVFQDEKQRPVETFFSEKLHGTEDWRKLRLGPLSPSSPQVRQAVVALHVQPGARPDLKGRVLFGDLWLARMPRMTLAVENGSCVIANPNQVAISCRISGFSQPAPSVDFELLDVFGQRLVEGKQQLEMQKVGSDTATKADGEADGPQAIGSARWKPEIPGLGFYRVRAAMLGERAIVHRRELPLAVIQSRHSLSGGEFGWTLPRGDYPLSLLQLGQLLPQAGVGWIKFPLWLGPASPEERVQELTGFVERLSLHGIEAIGMFDRPPEDFRIPEELSTAPTIADLLSLGREVWQPSLETTLTRLGPLVHWWQLGGDRDTSFVGYPRLSEKIAQIKAELDRVGFEVQLGVGWNWLHALPDDATGKQPYRFVALSAEPPLTPRELATYLAAAKRPGLRREVLIQPLSRKDYSVSDRALDLVERMMAAKFEDAEGIFVPEPFSTEHGLMNDDGTPGELFLPWRTASLILGGAEPLGSLCLPQGSSNRVFARPKDAVMVAWNRTPKREVLHLGDDVRQVDLWGRERPVEKTAEGHVIEVGPHPVFIVGMNKQLARWRLSFLLGSDRVPSVFGPRHANRFELKNCFPEGVEGSIVLAGPEDWALTPSQGSFRLSAGESFQQPFSIVLPSTAGSGRQLLRADFELHADQTYRFSTFSPIYVGLGDVRVEVVTQLNADGELEVEQRLINETNRLVGFRCQLFAPGRRRLSVQVVGLGHGQDVKTYRLPNGRELLGKMLWLQAQETDGPRMLNYRFIAEE